MAYGRSLVCLLFLAGTGFLTGFTPIFRGVDLNDPHIVGHIATGSFVVGLAVSRLSMRVAAGSITDYLLILMAVWYAALPWTIPDTPGVGAAGDYHDHAHVLIGSLQAAAAFWNALSTSDSPERTASPA
jgi:hypothetical protein